MKPIPLFGDGINAYSPVVSRQQRLNCFYDLRLDEDKAKTIIRGTPGTVLVDTFATSPIRGWKEINGILYVVAGSILYSYTSGGVKTALGTLSSTAGLIEMHDNFVQLGIVDGLHLYCYTIVTGTYSQAGLDAAGSFGIVTDANFPNGASTIDFLDGRMIVEYPNSRQFGISEYYDLTAWTNVSSLPTFGTKDNNSDFVGAISVVNGILILHGKESMEFWQDVGAFPLPYARIDGATQASGLAAIKSRVQFMQSLVYLQASQEGGLRFVMLNGYTPIRISNSDIEDIINGFSVYSDAVAFSYVTAGHPIYQVTFPSSSRSFIYDAVTTFWSEVQTGVELQARHFANLGVVFHNQNYVSDSSTGNIYRLDGTIYTDNGTSIKRQVASRHIRVGGNDFSIAELYLDMETGVGLQSGQGSNPQLMLQVSKDNGRTFGRERRLPLGVVGNYLSRVISRRFGSGNDFVFLFTMTDPVKFTITHGSATVDVEEGMNG